jgi:hypothetical protein
MSAPPWCPLPRGSKSSGRVTAASAAQGPSFSPSQTESPVATLSAGSGHEHGRRVDLDFRAGGSLQGDLAGRATQFEDPVEAAPTWRDRRATSPHRKDCKRHYCPRDRSERCGRDERQAARDRAARAGRALSGTASGAGDDAWRIPSTAAAATRGAATRCNAASRTRSSSSAASSCCSRPDSSRPGRLIALTRGDEENGASDG